MSDASPFEVLGIAPTLDVATIKRAYFGALKLHPPHQDAAAFQRIRGAYEQLSSPSSLAAAFLSGALDLAAELGAYADLDERVRSAVVVGGEQASAAERSGALVEALSGLPWAEALARFAG